MIMKKKFFKNKELNKNLKREKKKGGKRKKYIKIIKKYNFYNDIYNMIN
jgi:hypothetical protein